VSPGSEWKVGNIERKQKQRTKNYCLQYSQSACAQSPVAELGRQPRAQNGQQNEQSPKEFGEVKAPARPRKRDRLPEFLRRQGVSHHGRDSLRGLPLDCGLAGSGISRGPGGA
jgi:transposase